MRCNRRALFALLLAWIAPLAHAATYTEGKDYFRLDPPQHTSVPAGKVEVVEVFSYACPFCAQFNPYIDAFRKSLPPNAQMVFVPASFNQAEDWPMFQRATCTAQILGVFDKAHDAMFEAVWKTGELAIMDPDRHRILSPLPTIEDAAKFYHRVTGVPVEKFLATARSFSVDMRMRTDDALVTRGYQVDGTPTLIVNGKYRITGQSAGGLPQMIEVARFLVAQESK